jgi:hypothetical protein
MTYPHSLEISSIYSGIYQRVYNIYMSRMTRRLFTLDEETLKCLLLWNKKKIPSSEAVREAVKAYTRWKQKELAPKPEDFDGVDYEYGQES